MFLIPLNAPAALRRVPVFFENTDGSGHNTLTGITVKYRKPGSGADTDVTSLLVADGGDGRYYVQLDATGTKGVDVAGIGWVIWSGDGTTSPSIVAQTDYVQVDDRAGQAFAAVWDGTGLSSHRVADSFGYLAQTMAGLLHQNALLDNLSYGANAVLTSARLRVFASKAACNAATPGAGNNADGEIFRFTITAVDAGSGEISSYKLVQDL